MPELACAADTAELHAADTDGWTVRVHIEGPGTFADMSCEVPYGLVEIHGFDAVEEAAHDVVGQLVETFRLNDAEADGTWVH